LNFKLSRTQSELVDLIRKAGGTVYVVGGAVRDSILGLEPKDLDFAHTLSVDDLQYAASAIGIEAIPDSTAYDHGILRFPNNGKLIDMACLRKDNETDGRHATVSFTKDILEDLARRDLTINAMATEIFPDGTCREIIDPFFGQADIQGQVICFVGNSEQRIKEDYLRMMRFCRFAALGEGWFLDPDGEKACKKYAIDIARVSKERIRDELVKGLMYPKPSAMFRAMQSIGLLDFVFPDLARGVGCEQNIHHLEPVFDHLLRCLDSSVSLTSNPMLRLAVLTHDIAKPHTKKIINNDATFYNHEVVGASVMYNWMKEYKFSRKECEYVSKMVRHHQFRMDTDSDHHYECDDCGCSFK
jgi:tRNA nucleotidyltransferase/poly(A) polymerase